MIAPILDRRFELDWRSLDYPITSVLHAAEQPVYRPRSYTWTVDRWHDQGREGACVGFAFTHDLAARPQVVTDTSEDFARLVYREAQKIDPWPGEAYEGTSVLAGAKVLQRHGLYLGYRWAFTAEEVAKAVAYFGPGVLGVNWFTGMFDTDPDGFIAPEGAHAGGHAILVHSVKIHYRSLSGWLARTWRDVDWDRSYVVLHNSWGPSWGVKGRAKLTLRHLDVLLGQDGEACFPLRNYGDRSALT